MFKLKQLNQKSLLKYKSVKRSTDTDVSHHGWIAEVIICLKMWVRKFLTPCGLLELKAPLFQSRARRQCTILSEINGRLSLLTITHIGTLVRLKRLFTQDINT